MPAYMIAEMDITDPVGYEAYKAAAGDVITRYGGRYLHRGGATESLEGEPPKRVVVVVFDDMAAARRWYDSPEYQAARKLRDKSALGRLFVVDAFEA